jgi:hypothetical protein
MLNDGGGGRVTGATMALLLVLSGCFSDGKGGADAGSTRYADIYIWPGGAGVPPTSHYVMAQFFDASARKPRGATELPVGIVAKEGLCLVAGPAASIALEDLEPPISAGVVTLGGGSSPIVLTKSEEPATGSTPATVRYSHSGPEIFPAGTTLTLTATGAAAPAFSLPITIPTPLSVTLPVAPSSPDTPLKVARSSGLPVAWTAGSSANTVTVFLSHGADGSWPSLTCDFPESAGSGVVPASLLSHLDAGSGWALAISPQSTVSISVDGWLMSAYASGPADANVAKFPLALQ